LENMGLEVAFEKGQIRLKKKQPATQW
jgi:hypothetical protein